MEFSFAITPLSIILLAAVAVLGAVSLWAGLRPMWAVARRKNEGPAPARGSEEVPGISVVVYTLNAEQTVRRTVADLLAQDAPLMEVILVVDEASWDNTKTVACHLAETDERVYCTYVPASARNVSRRKTAFTLGLKAAKYPVALLTTSDVQVPSPCWVRLMAEPFANKYTDIAIGADYVPAGTDRGAGRWWRSFFTVTGEAQWLGWALLGHPYRGTACNLALRTSTFFAHKGFASSTTLVGGEDDIFVSEVAREGNTAVVTAPEAMPALELPSDEYPRLWLRRKERYAFTASLLRTRLPLLQGLSSLTLWAALLCAVAGALLPLAAEPFNIFPPCAALIVMTGIWGCQIAAYRGAATALRARRLFWYVPVLYLVRPLATALYRAAFRRGRDANYVWHETKTR